MLKTKNLTFIYKGKKIIDNVNLEINSGEIMVLIGPNGAGKTTTINSIIGLLKYDGEVLINGYNNKSLDAKKIIGYIPEIPDVYDYLTVNEHLEFVSKAYKIKDWKEKAKTLLERFELTDCGTKIGKELSKGMKQKLNICCALLINPLMLICDEPFVGLDPFAIHELKMVFSECKNRGVSVLISTHILDSVKDIWDKATVINNGRILGIYSKNQTKETNELEKIFFNLKLDLGENQ